MRYVIIARDGTDAEAKARRLAARPAHLERVGPFVERGRILIGGAMLDDAGDMVGSVLLTDFSSREEIDAWIADDPYVTGGCGRRSRFGTSARPSAPGCPRTDFSGGRIRPG